MRELHSTKFIKNMAKKFYSQLLWVEDNNEKIMQVLAIILLFMIAYDVFIIKAISEILFMWGFRAQEML